MRRRTVSILLLLSISISLYAVTTWYSPYSASFSVDLKNHKSSTGYELNGTKNGFTLYLIQEITSSTELLAKSSG